MQDAFASGNVPLYHVRGYGLPVHRAGGWPQRGRAGTHTAHHPQPARATFSARDHKKGKGYQPAEVNPGNYHGVSAFDPDGMPDPEVAPKESFSTVFGNALVTEGNRNPNICAITAAMKYGTGLQFFAHSHPERFFDVGMAEQHAVTFAAGLASQGMLPVVCIYSTFLQRSYDQIIHDVNLLRENVVFAIDRAGFVPADGETHQGIYDPAFLSQLGMPLYAPSNYQELNYWLQQLLSDRFHGPRAIRYPRGGQDAALAEFGCTGEDYDFLRKAMMQQSFW